MTTYDCCMVYSELDMLDLRLHMLADVVDEFVWVEASETHSGLQKPNTIGDTLKAGRFAEFADKIVYVHLDHLQGENSWARERYHRSMIEGYLHYAARPDDWVIVADADEIPYAEAVTQALTLGADAAVLEMALYYYNFSLRLDMGWGIGMCKWGVLQDANRIRRCEFAGLSATTIARGGLHLSYFLTPEQVVDKLNAFMHHADVARDVPRDPLWIAERMRNGEDLFNRTTAIERIAPNGDLPRYVAEHAEQYKALGWLE